MNNIRDFVLIDPVANQVKNSLDFCENFFLLWGGKKRLTSSKSSNGFSFISQKFVT